MIAVLAIGISIISIGFFTNQQVEEVVTTITPYEKLEKYREELEKINQYNQQLLIDLENQIANSDDVHLEQLKKEIEVLKQVIDDNKKELDQVIQRLSEMKEQ
jgi:adenylosuccinate synthase